HKDTASVAISDVPLDPAAGSMDRPDIYMIVLDAHGRSDIVKQIYGVDNSAFTSALRHRGFVVPTHNTSNYYRTIQSLTSTLNCCYLSDMKLDAFTDGADPHKLIRNSLV